MVGINMIYFYMLWRFVKRCLHFKYVGSLPCWDFNGVDVAHLLWKRENSDRDKLGNNSLKEAFGSSREKYTHKETNKNRFIAVTLYSMAKIYIFNEIIVLAIV